MSTSTKNQMLTTPFWIKIGVAIYKEKISSNSVNIIALIGTSEISCCRQKRWTKHWDFNDDERIKDYIWHQGSFTVAVTINPPYKILQKAARKKIEKIIMYQSNMNHRIHRIIEARERNDSGSFDQTCNALVRNVS